MSKVADQSVCPHRKLVPSAERTAPGTVLPDVERVVDQRGERWVVRSFTIARQILREPEATRQAGFGADSEQGAGPKMRPPILYLEGHQHRNQRRATARFFAPKVTEEYRTSITALSDQLIGRVRTDRWTDLSELTMLLAVQVAAQVVGLTNSTPTAMSRRLSTFFNGDPTQRPTTPAGWVRQAARATGVARFYWFDVLPAIRARRQSPREDVISQLLEQDFSGPEILTECLTYGAAGMVTTREFIQAAAWHLLESPTLLERYRAGSMDERLAILHETLRLEPVVGHLFRRAQKPITVNHGDTRTVIAPTMLIDFDLRSTNSDAGVVGERGEQLCPGRDLPPAVPPTLLSFGDGNHRCPGAPLAIMESEVFLTALFAHDIAAAGPPHVDWNPVSQGYGLTRFLIKRRTS